MWEPHLNIRHRFQKDSAKRLNALGNQSGIFRIREGGNRGRANERNRLKEQEGGKVMPVLPTLTRIMVVHHGGNEMTVETQLLYWKVGLSVKPARHCLLQEKLSPDRVDIIESSPLSRD